MSKRMDPPPCSLLIACVAKKQYRDSTGLVLRYYYSTKQADFERVVVLSILCVTSPCVGTNSGSSVYVCSGGTVNPLRNIALCGY